MKPNLLSLKDRRDHLNLQFAKKGIKQKTLDDVF